MDYRVIKWRRGRKLKRKINNNFSCSSSRTLKHSYNNSGYKINKYGFLAHKPKRLNKNQSKLMLEEIQVFESKFKDKMHILKPITSLPKISWENAFYYLQNNYIG